MRLKLLAAGFRRSELVGVGVGFGGGGLGGGGGGGGGGGRDGEVAIILFQLTGSLLQMESALFV